MMLAWRQERKRKRTSDRKNKEFEGDKETNKRECGQYVERGKADIDGKISEDKENTRWRVHR